MEMLVPLLRDRIDHLAVDVELQLVDRAVRDAHRAGTAPTREMAQDPLAPRALAEDVVEHLQSRLRAPRRVEQPMAERFSFVAVSEAEESARGERGVAQPAEAVVPVVISVTLF